MIYLSIPTPPSANKLFKNVPGLGRVKTKAYKTWIDETIGVIRRSKQERIEGRTIVLIACERVHSTADIDNRIKPTIDALVKSGIIDDDKNVQAAAAVWMDDAGKGKTSIVIASADEPLTFTYDPRHSGRVGFLVQQKDD